MSEYIIDTEKINELNRGSVTSWLSPYAISDTSGFPPRIKETHFAVTLPEIVRCRDCKYYIEDTDPIDPGWPMMCADSGRDMLEPYGFCAWGERRTE